MAEPNRPLRRSKTNRWIGGVCGGLAEWLRWDVTLGRVLSVLVSVFPAAVPGILAYIIFWIIMPEEE